MNSLGLSVKNQTGSHLLLIYYKPSHTDTIIPKCSNYPHSHKLAAFYSMIHRLTFEELNIIKQIAYNNGYSQQYEKKFSRKNNIIIV